MVVYTYTLPAPFSRTITVSPRMHAFLLIVGFVLAGALTSVTANPNNAIVILDPADNTVLGALLTLVWISRGHIILSALVAFPSLIGVGRIRRFLPAHAWRRVM